MDLHVDEHIIFDNDTRSVPPFSPLLVDPYDQKAIDAMFTMKFRLPHYIPPGARVLMSTVESVNIAENTLGLICLRSTWARLGFMSPPTTADPGFRGQLTMELVNTSHHKIEVKPGDAVWTLHMLMLVPGIEPMYWGRYQEQSGLQLPRAFIQSMGTGELKAGRTYTVDMTDND